MRQPRQSLTERRTLELRLAIAQAARELFVQAGNTSPTISQICEIVGIVPRTFHRHFTVKEDVLGPLFEWRAGVILSVLADAPADADVVETLTRAFTTDVESRGSIQSDRQLMRVVVDDLAYRLRWLQWWEQFAAPITQFLSGRVELPDDPFLRKLPAELVMQASRLIYLRWVDTGDFDETRRLHHEALQGIITGCCK